MAELRRAYHDRIAELKGRAEALLAKTADAVDRLTTALLERDEAALVRLVGDVDGVAEEPKRIEEDVLDTIAREAPVARDLRVVLASLFISQGTALCLGLVRTLASRSGPADEVLTPVLRGLAYEIGEETVDLLRLDAAAWAVMDGDRALAAIDGSERSRRLQRRFLGELLDLDDVPIEAAVDLGMMARAYERFTDHAVDIASRVVFAATGAPPAAAALTGEPL
jgi:phosphate transport system protein